MENKTEETAKTKIPTIIGAMRYNCVKCKKEVTIEYRPAIGEKTSEFFKKMFNKKLCSECIEKGK